MSMSKITIGCDPETFLYDKKERMFVSAAGLFPGDKKNPHKLKDGAVQVDGVALEFNIDPVTTVDDFTTKVQSVLKQLKEMVKDVNPNWTMKYVPIAHFDDNVWNDIPEDAKVLGCDPDFECFNGKVNRNPADVIHKIPLRTASGHIHIGWTNGEKVDDPMHFEDCRFIAHKFFSYNIFGPRSEDERRRLQYYGMNGSFRPKPYGVELRMPSNKWLYRTDTIRAAADKTLNFFGQITQGKL
jgi:hypothetical protein